MAEFYNSFLIVEPYLSVFSSILSPTTAFCFSHLPVDASKLFSPRAVLQKPHNWQTRNWQTQGYFSGLTNISFFEFSPLAPGFPPISLATASRSRVPLVLLYLLNISSFYRFFIPSALAWFTPVALFTQTTAIAVKQVSLSVSHNYQYNLYSTSKMVIQKKVNPITSFSFLIFFHLQNNIQTFSCTHKSALDWAPQTCLPRVLTLSRALLSFICTSTMSCPSFVHMLFPLLKVSPPSRKL